MPKGQQQRARQPVSRDKGRETSSPRKPSGNTQSASTSLVRTQSEPKSADFGKPPVGSRSPHRRRAKDVPGNTSSSARRDTDQTPREQRAPTAKVARAKKLVVRDPGQKVQGRARKLREVRVDHDHIERIRLQKALAQSGVGSRREMEEWIEAGWILINGKKATLGDKVGPDDRVTVKGSAIKLKWADRLPRVILYHKQEGEMVTRDDPQGRVTVFDRLPQAKSSRWVAVGRLDVNTSGLMIITTSGELANHMMHPSFKVEREYAVRVLGELTMEQRREMCKEIMLEDGPAHFESITDQGGEGVNHWYRVVLKEGRNREVRRLFEHFSLQVSRLMRVRFGQIGLPPRLKRGQFYELNEIEVAAVMKWANLTIAGAKPRR